VKDQIADGATRSPAPDTPTRRRAHLIRVMSAHTSPCQGGARPPAQLEELVLRFGPVGVQHPGVAVIAAIELVRGHVRSEEIESTLTEEDDIAWPPHGPTALSVVRHIGSANVASANVAVLNPVARSAP